MYALMDHLGKMAHKNGFYVDSAEDYTTFTVDEGDFLLSMLTPESKYTITLSSCDAVNFEGHLYDANTYGGKLFILTVINHTDNKGNPFKTSALIYHGLSCHKYVLKRLMRKMTEEEAQLEMKDFPASVPAFDQIVAGISRLRKNWDNPIYDANHKDHSHVDAKIFVGSSDSKGISVSVNKAVSSRFSSGGPHGTMSSVTYKYQILLRQILGLNTGVIMWETKCEKAAERIIALLNKVLNVGEEHESIHEEPS